MLGGLTRRLGAVLDGMVDDEIRDHVARLDIAAGEYGYDRWGASPRDAERLLVWMRFFLRRYFRAEVSGLEHIPEGRCLIIGNHSGQLAYDGMVICAALALDAEPPRFARAMIEHFFVQVPFVGTLMTRMGQLTGLPGNAERLLLEDEAAVLVFPEGARGGGKVWRDRYKLMGFGQGFVRLALKTKTPVVPFGFVGGEEMVPSFSQLPPLARMLNTPYVPLTPTILPLPLPTKVHLLFGEPMRFEGNGDEDDEVILPMVERVEHAVEALIERGLSERRGVFAR
jgi:1-acyl-sn-glycerol-3-phosphate acyltransferase